MSVCGGVCLRGRGRGRRGWPPASLPGPVPSCWVQVPCVAGYALVPHVCAPVQAPLTTTVSVSLDRPPSLQWQVLEIGAGYGANFDFLRGPDVAEVVGACPAAQL
jgi:hypothetical protein